jgi:uncharacterized protein YkwD
MRRRSLLPILKSVVRPAWKLAALVAVLVAAVVSTAAALASTAQPAHRLTRSASLESGVLEGLNRVRREHGLVPLRLSAALSAAAREHSRSMAVKGYFSHDSADGSSFWERIKRFYTQHGYRFWSVGENLLWSSPDVDPAEAVKLWLASPPHRKDLLTPAWREIGVAAVHADSAPGTYGGRPVTIITTDFGVRR